MAETPILERALAWACARPVRIAGYNPWEVAVRLWRAVVKDRVTGLAAEMAFFALLSLVPLLVAIGAGLGYLERIIGREQVAEAQATVIDALSVVFSPDLTREVIAPFVEGLLTQERTGLALGSLAVTLYLSSRVFTATIRALDLAYNVEDRRGLLAQRGLAVLFAVAAVVVFVLMLGFLVVGPLFGGGRVLAERLGFGRLFAFAWALGRWPLLVVLVIGFLALLYRLGPQVDNRWRECLPGAVLGVVLWVLVSLGFRLYLDAGGGVQTPQFGEEEEALRAAGRVVGAVVASVLWIYLSGVAILVGGELNAELALMREERQDP
ncbi:MAG TPA: YihY/virulence factor BrkB family protein [Egibacteraceae bacterium]|nr:YihY/virulence factor BrkB family protein [Egibacteraceae bacterium]